MQRREAGFELDHGSQDSSFEALRIWHTLEIYSSDGIEAHVVLYLKC
jgi:hypothetical protein